MRIPYVITFQVKIVRRAVSFRQEVLVAYEYRCALCGFGLNLADKRIGVEAAQILWHLMGWPGEVNNGLARCYQYYKLFDLGRFTINRNDAVEVSRLANSWSQKNQQIFPDITLLHILSDECLWTADNYLRLNRDNAFKI